MEKEPRFNQTKMSLLKKMHDLIAEPDIEKQRQAQENLAALTKVPKEILLEEVFLDSMKCEWIQPDRPHMKTKVILYCHGGGYTAGSCSYARSITTKLALETSLDVFCFNYRLAPEHPYPAALEDALVAWNYLMLLGYGARDIIVGGDSAGGNLALALSLKLKEEHRFLPGGLLLYSPWTDLTASGKSYSSKADIDPILSMEYVQRMTECYASEEEITNPLVSPLFGDFTGFPPVYIQVGGNEILHSDSSMLYKKLLSANVSVKMDSFPGMWHVFQMSPFKKSVEALEKSAEFIFEVLR